MSASAEAERCAASEASARRRSRSARSASAQSFERFEVRARVFGGRALALGGAAGVGEPALQILQAARGRIPFDFEPVGHGARLRDAPFGLVQSGDGALALFGLAS
jgi:hypothetical protein